MEGGKRPKLMPVVTSCRWGGGVRQLTPNWGQVIGGRGAGHVGLDREPSAHFQGPHLGDYDDFLDPTKFIPRQVTAPPTLDRGRHRRPLCPGGGGVDMIDATCRAVCGRYLAGKARMTSGCSCGPLGLGSTSHHAPSSPFLCIPLCDEHRRKKIFLFITIPARALGSSCIRRRLHVAASPAEVDDLVIMTNVPRGILSTPTAHSSPP